MTPPRWTAWPPKASCRPTADDAAREAIRAAKDMDAKIDIIFAEDERTCHTVRAHDGKAFEPDEVPELPVPGCDAETCRCLYGNVFDD